MNSMVAEEGAIIDSSLALAEEVAWGRIHAHRKHGQNSIESINASDPRWLSILVEEVGELAHEMTYDSGGNLDTIRAEALDVASEFPSGDELV